MIELDDFDSLEETCEFLLKLLGDKDDKIKNDLIFYCRYIGNFCYMENRKSRYLDYDSDDTDDELSKDNNKNKYLTMTLIHKNYISSENYYKLIRIIYFIDESKDIDFVENYSLNFIDDHLYESCYWSSISRRMNEFYETINELT